MFSLPHSHNQIFAHPEISKLPSNVLQPRGRGWKSTVKPQCTYGNPGGFSKQETSRGALPSSFAEQPWASSEVSQPRTHNCGSQSSLWNSHCLSGKEETGQGTEGCLLLCGS